MKFFINGRAIDLYNTKIMGILNVTPDSFSDGGDYQFLSQAIDHVNYMIVHGATFIDIGGESTRPGAHFVTETEEIDRVIPVIQAVVQRFDTFISVNTSSELVIRESAAAGAHLINDVRSLASKGAMQAAIYCDLPVCLVHMQGSPKTMQDSPKYSNIINEINGYFIKQIERCESAGISRTKLLIDPGFGFGKNLSHNFQLLANLKYFLHFKLPVLVGISRKSMLLGNHRNQHNCLPKQRLIGSVTCAVIAAMQGVHIVRVHDVKETAEALYILNMMRTQKHKK